MPADTLLALDAPRPVGPTTGPPSQSLEAIAKEASAQQAALAACIDAMHAWPATTASEILVPLRVLKDASPRAAAHRAAVQAIRVALDELQRTLGPEGRIQSRPDGLVVRLEPAPAVPAATRTCLAAVEHARARTRQSALHLVRAWHAEDAAPESTAQAACPQPPVAARPPRPARVPRRVHLDAPEAPTEHRLAKARVLTGPNVHANHPVVLAEFEADVPLRPGALDELVRALPEAATEVAGAAAGLVAGRVALALQARAGCAPTLAPVTVRGDAFAFAFAEPDAGIEAAYQAAALLRDATRGDPLELDEAIRAVREAARATAFGPSTASIVAECARRDIPVTRLDDASYLQLGQGVNQRRMQASLASTTSGIGMEIADDKARTKAVLAEAGIRVPQGETVADVEDAIDAAERLGYPVVLKPLVGNHGRGVSTCLRDADQVRAAYELANAIHARVVVEQHIEGRDFRVLVVGGRLVAAARRDPAHVVGDGRSTIEQLVEDANRDPRRGEGHEAALSRIRIDDATLQLLARTHRTPETVPAAGERVDLKGTANLSTGGTATDVTDLVHPDVRRACERAARMVGLDIMGLDIVAHHLEAPLEETRGAVVEVNAAPGLRMHLHPSHGTPRNVAAAIVEMLYPRSAPSRIPIVAITGTNGKTTTTRLVARILQQAGLRVGVATTSGVELDGGIVQRGDYAGPDGARLVLKDPATEAAVLEVARGGILRRGLGFDRCDVGVLLNIAADHLGDAGVETLEDLARVKGVVLRSIAPGGTAVVNADDPLALDALQASGARAILFSAGPGLASLQAHVAAGGMAVGILDGRLVLAHDGGVRPILDLADIPCTFGGKVAFNVANVAAATAVAVASCVPLGSIREALRSFRPDARDSPGRMNLVRVGDVDAILDYGHNPAALAAMAEALPAFGDRRRIGVASASGNRRDADIDALGQQLARMYDAVVVTDPDPRGRAPGATMQRCAAAARAAGLADVREEAKERDAIAAALRMARPGDLLVLHVDDLKGAMSVLEGAMAASPAGPAAGEGASEPTGRPLLVTIPAKA